MPSPELEVHVQIIYLLGAADSLQEPERQAKITDGLAATGRRGGWPDTRKKVESLTWSFTTTAMALAYLADAPKSYGGSRAELRVIIERLGRWADVLERAVAD